MCVWGQAVQGSEEWVAVQGMLQRERKDPVKWEDIAWVWWGKDCSGVSCEHSGPQEGGWLEPLLLLPRRCPWVCDVAWQHKGVWWRESRGSGCFLTSNHSLILCLTCIIHPYPLPPILSPLGAGGTDPLGKGVPHCWNTSSGLLISIPLQLSKFNHCFSPLLCVVFFFGLKIFFYCYDLWDFEPEW